MTVLSMLAVNELHYFSTHLLRSRANTSNLPLSIMTMCKIYTSAGRVQRKSAPSEHPAIERLCVADEVAADIPANNNLHN